MRKKLCELAEDILLHFDRRVSQQRLQGGQVSALGQNRFQRSLGLRFQVFRRLFVNHTRQQVPQNVSLRQGSGVVGGVATYLSKSPRTGRLDMVLGFRDQCFL